MNISSNAGVPAINTSMQGTVSRSGTIQGGNSGSGTFTTTLERANGMMATVDEVITSASGQTVQHNSTITYNADASINDVITTTGPNGHTFMRDDTLTPNPATGTAAISGTYTNAQGQTGTLTGTMGLTNGGFDTNLTLTNPSGQSETIDSQTSLSGNTLTNTITGTTFAGTAISNGVVKLFA